MYMDYSFGRGDIIFYESDYYLILSCDSRDGELILTAITGDYVGVTFIKRFDEIVDKIEKHYLGFGDLINSMCARQKEKISTLREAILLQKDEYKASREQLADAWSVISAKNDEIISLSDEIGALKEELQEHYEIADFKNKEIERLQKEVLRMVNKDTFDKTVNDMLNNKDISTVEEVSAIMKLRSAIY